MEEEFLNRFRCARMADRRQRIFRVWQLEEQEGRQGGEEIRTRHERILPA